MHLPGTLAVLYSWLLVKLVASFMAVAHSMKECARMAETFAGYIKEGSITPAAAALLPIDFSMHNGPAIGRAASGRKGAAAPNDGTEPTTGKRARKEKKIRDPNAPKRPPSAYLLYQNSVREDTKKQFPNLPYQAVLAEISKAWHALSEEDRKVHMSLYYSRTLH